MVANTDIRNYAKNKKVCAWQIAERLNICEMSYFRLLRKELTAERKTELIKIIDDIAE